MKNYKMKFLAVFTVMFLVGSSLFAQTKDNRWAVGLHTNITEYRGDLGMNGFFKFENLNPGAGLSLAYYLSPTFDISAKGTWSHVAHEDKTGTFAKGAKGYADLVGTYNNENWSFYGGLWTATANLKMKLNNGWLFKEDATIAPFIIGGVGVTRIDQTSVKNYVSSKKYSNLALYYGAGFNLRLSERLNMVLEAGLYNPMTDVYDGVDATTAPGWVPANNSVGGDVSASDDQFLQYSLGFTYNLGKKKDADGDGVADRKDKCPNTPAGVAVDEDGCPIDTDGDGVPDYLDKCPNVPGTVDGCPDRDGDGVADKDDACPDVAGLKSLQGCPDADGDGVPDHLDKCPNTPKGVKVDAKGCPVDTDGDGVADYLDKCPTVKGPASNNGCPVEVKAEYYEKVVYFRFNSSRVDRKAIETLNEVVDKMKELPAVNANISGHTDNIGSDAINQRFSERRANAVKKYLVSKGIDESRIVTTGLGESAPVDTNDTKAGRANNRRAEIKIRIK